VTRAGFGRPDPARSTITDRDAAPTAQRASPGIGRPWADLRRIVAPDVGGYHPAAMVRIAFTANLRRHLPCPVLQSDGLTVGEALSSAFAGNSRLRGYVLDDQSRLRRHVVLYVNGRQAGLEMAIADGDEIYVMQALSGG